MGKQTVKPYDEQEARQQATAAGKGTYDRERALRGVGRWQAGKQSLTYARDGYRTIAGEAVKTKTSASGITQTFGTNRKARRAGRKAKL